MLVYETETHKNSARGTREIDLSGPQGKAFALIGVAKQYAQQLDLDPNKVAAEMITSDYIDLVLYFDKRFGYYVDLLVPDSIKEELHARRFAK